MSASIPALLGLIFFFLAYRFYASYLSKKIFGLNEIQSPVPSKEFHDGVDFVATKKPILIGHHFSSIAGAAPIVGPAVAAIWGWMPALLWIIVGVIFMGACHDFGALVVSMKHKGQSMAALSKDLLGPRSRTLFLIVIFFLVWMVIAVFALVIAGLFKNFPSAVLPVNFEIIIAVIMGVLINKKGGDLKIPSLLAQLGLFVMIYLGTKFPISLSPIVGAENEIMAWIIFLLIYSMVASTLPVWTLLQPRDYINSHQLFLGLTLMVVGLFVVNPEITAPAVNLNPDGAPPWFPFLFITIACGAISGFHGLVSSGTTSKQVANWKDAKPVGYGSMLGEGLLALLATLAVSTGFSSRAAWHSHYASWNQANGLNAKIAAFVKGAGGFLEGLMIPTEVSQTVIAVLIISFAATSLDTAARIQRYIIAELGEAYEIKSLKNRFVGSGIAVGSAFLLMMTSSGGKGGLQIWPLFGATNQVLAGLTLLVIAVYLKRNRRNFYPYLIPALVVIIITMIGMVYNFKNFLDANKTLLTILAGLLFILNLWILFEGTLAIKQQNPNIDATKS